MSAKLYQYNESFQNKEIIRARDRFYPGWWTYAFNTFNTEGSKPLFRVRCKNREELILAAAAKPRYIRAEIFIA